jgi:hypothetical protein
LESWRTFLEGWVVMVKVMIIIMIIIIIAVYS